MVIVVHRWSGGGVGDHRMKEEEEETMLIAKCEVFASVVVSWLPDNNRHCCTVTVLSSVAAVHLITPQCE